MSTDPSALTDLMMGLLRTVLEEERGPHTAVVANPSSPLIGEDAILTSLGLVSFIGDVEAGLEDAHGIEVTLVSERALSRRRSPFRSVDTLVQYVVELVDSRETGR